MFVLITCKKKNAGTESSSSSQVGDFAPDFVLKDISGNDVALSMFKGKVVLLEFWATWCPPCRASIPGLIAMQEKYGSRGLVVLGVSLDEGQNLAAKLTEFSREVKTNYAILLGTEHVAKAYNVRSIPVTFFIDKEGRIEQYFMGYTERFTENISELIEKNI